MAQEIHLLVIIDKDKPENDNYQPLPSSNNDSHCLKQDVFLANIDSSDISPKNSFKQKVEKDLAAQCEFCGKEYANHKRLKDHLRFCHPKVYYECSICNQQFPKKWLLTVHTRKHTKEFPYRCPACEKSFISNSQLKIHTNFHHGENNLQCKTCGAVGFYSKQDLENHIRTKHTKERAFHCKICNQSFMSSCVYYQHRSVHSGIKKYSCEFCSKSFARWMTLHNHIKIHKDQRPFSCDVCGRAFRQKYDVKKHKLNQHANIVR